MPKKIICVLCALLLLCGCGPIRDPVPEPVETVDPHAGMVQVESGYGTQIWVKEYKDVPVNPFRETVIGSGQTIRDENGFAYEALRGIDVSEHQGAVDWAQLAADGLDFALLRVGYRGYGESGSLVPDARFTDNIKGASENRIRIGAYFFSQATTVEEAEEEADFLLRLLTLHEPEEFSLPIFFDWEYIEGADARTDGVSGETVTECALAFCERLRDAGYTPGIYTYRSLAYTGYDLSRIREYPLWIGAVGENPDFYYRFDIWQYSIHGSLNGVSGDVDLDVIFSRVPQDRR